MRSYDNVGRKKGLDKIIISFYCEVDLHKELEEYSFTSGFTKTEILNKMMKKYL